MKKVLLFFIFTPISLLFAQTIRQKVKIDVNSFRNQLLNSPNENIIGVGKVHESTTIISLPFRDATLQKFKVVEYTILPKGVNANIKTYYGQKIDDATIGCRISITKDKMFVAIFTENEVVAIEPSKNAINSDDYEVFTQEAKNFECKTESSLGQNGRIRDIESISNYSNGTTLRTYRFAFMVTNEFYTARGGTDASVNTDIAATINTLNGIYERDLAVRFVLASPTNPSSTNVFYRNTTTTSTYNQNLSYVHTQLNTVFGSTNFDIGHCLHSTGGGVAYLSAVCNSSLKGGGWSGISSPTDMFVFAHEVGHQFNANHTFSGNGGGCTAANLSISTAYEPGSGNTIMSYNSICDATLNITGGKTNYFHTNSLQSMISYIQTGLGSTCPVTVATGNTPPVVVAGTAITIPKNTPFTLIGSGTDANGDVLSYTWEQYDLPVANDIGALGSATNGVGGYPAVNSTTAPLFRSLQSSSPMRVFPSLKAILNNDNNPADTDGEDLPNVSRTMNFRLTARDNRIGGGGTHCSSIVVTVDATKGPLTVNLPNGGETWVAGSTQTINWNVNSTNTLSPNVDVYLSVDGGESFPYLILNNTPNDGTQPYLVDANIITTTQARIKVVSKDNPTSNFFDISNANFIINSNCQPSGSSICSDADLTAQSGNANLNLGLSFTPTAKFTGSSKVFSTTGAVSRMIVGYTDNTFTTCQNIFSANSILIKFRVEKTGSYNIGVLRDNITSSEPFSIFTTNTFNCSNLVGSNAYSLNGPVGWNGSRTIDLNACTTYYIVVFTFGSPANITLTISGLGDVYEEVSNPTDYSYTYVAIDNVTNLVSAESSTSNFTALPAGSFDVYGVMYKNGIIPSSFVGQTLNTVISSNCLLFSYNKKRLTLTPNPCASNLTLISPTDNITTGTVIKQASATNGTIIATNAISGAGTSAIYQAKNIQLNAGFSAAIGSVFKAEIGGCN